jgi:hypothetical protein
VGPAVKTVCFEPTVARDGVADIGGPGGDDPENPLVESSWYRSDGEDYAEVSVYCSVGVPRGGVRTVRIAWAVVISPPVLVGFSLLGFLGFSRTVLMTRRDDVEVFPCRKWLEVFN